ncbi:MAG TPA: response regulator [Candidatus Thermoplasmatota archaeon]|nr:response regulator [Candidatus Thermoplasmatota archaeon]
MKTAVVLDTDEFFREFQVFLLSNHGYRVLTPERAEDFTPEWVRQHDPDLLVTEVILPGGNGFELVRKLRHMAGVRCSIIMFTVLGARARAIAAGADAFVQKPILRDAYLSTIRDLTKDEP